MEGAQQVPQLEGVFGAVGRLVAPSDVVQGRLTTLLGTLWLTGGAWILGAWSLGLYDQGWRSGMGILGVTTVAIGAVLLLLRQRQLGTSWNVALTLLGSLVIALAVLWGGPRGAGATGVLYVYVTCFAAVALHQRAVVITLVSAGLHLVALLVGGYEATAAIWGLTWGTAIVTGLILGAAVEWLRQLVRRLEEAGEHKTRFVATVSHELRTPLTAILGFSETLQSEWDRLDEEQRRRFIDVIDRQAGRQLRLVDDVMTMATLLRGSLTAQPEQVDVRRLVTELVEPMPFPVEVEVTDPVTATVDPHHLERILGNLLLNADRYGAPPLIVRARARDHGIRIDVVDHGTGLSGGLEARLLEPFVQGDSGDRRSSVGVGLGLAVCRDLLDLNHGRLEYHQTPGGGATFRLTLPCQPTPTVRTCEQAHPGAPHGA